MLVFTIFTVYTASMEVSIMASKALNLKWDSDNLTEIKEVTQVYHMTLT